MIFKYKIWKTLCNTSIKGVPFYVQVKRSSFPLWQAKWDSSQISDRDQGILRPFHCEKYINRLKKKVVFVGNRTGGGVSFVLKSGVPRDTSTVDRKEVKYV